MMTRVEYRWLALVVASSVLLGDVVAVAKAGDGLLGAWSFEEETGLVVKDSSGNGLDGAITNPGNVTRSTGRSGRGLEFSGSERHKLGCVLVPGVKRLDFSKGFSIEAWVRFNDQHVRRDTCYIASDGDWKGPGWRFLVPYNHLFVQSGDGDAMWGASSNAAEHGGLENNRWYHMAGTFDGSVFRVYIDGVEVGGSKTGLTITEGTDTLSIGAYSGGLSAGFKGTLDEVKVYGRARSGLEIAVDARLR